MKTPESFELAEILPEPWFLVDVGGAVKSANLAARRLFALPSEELGTLGALCAEPPEVIAAYLRTCSRVRQPCPGALRLRDGGKQHVEGALLVPRGGEQEALVALRFVPPPTAEFRALTERVEALNQQVALRRRAEEEVRRQRQWLQVTLLSIGDAVIVTDTAAHVLMMNPVALKLTGWPEQEAAGRHLEEVFHIINETTRQRCPNPLGPVLAHGLVQGLANHTILIGKDGAEWPIDDSAAPILDPDGRVIGAVLVFHEIRERRRLERLAQERLDELVTADRRKDEFLATLAHELRNPLAPVVTAAALLRNDSTTPASRERATAIISRQVQRMSVLLDDLLDLSRITHGRVQLRCKAMDVRDLVERALETCAQLIEERRLSVHTAVTAGLPPLVADPIRMEQVLGNLIENAAKYTPAGGTIWITAAAPQGDDQLELRVRDDGDGMTPDLVCHAFDLFVQGERSLHRTQGGLGIGLTVVRQLVELHGGRCSCRSAGPGHGSEFTVRVPFSRDAAADRPAPQPIATAAKRALRVLVVDDNLDGAALLGEILELDGHQVSVFHDGPAALEAMRASTVDVALLDIGLPGMDGYELARRLRDLPGLGRCVLVAVTGYGQDRDRALAVEAGFAHHLLKPVDPAALSTLLTGIRP